jgi:hypothetical protein
MVELTEYLLTMPSAKPPPHCSRLPLSAVKRCASLIAMTDLPPTLAVDTFPRRDQPELGLRFDQG